MYYTDIYWHDCNSKINQTTFWIIDKSNLYFINILNFQCIYCAGYHISQIQRINGKFN